MSNVTARERIHAREPVAVDGDLGHSPGALPCQLWDPNLWFAESPEDVEVAKAICRTCPVRSTCLDVALERHESAGVWGGEVFLDGQVVTHRRPRGRPRKNSPWAAAPAPLSVEAR